MHNQRPVLHHFNKAVGSQRVIDEAGLVKEESFIHHDVVQRVTTTDHHNNKVASQTASNIPLLVRIRNQSTDALYFVLSYHCTQL